MMDAKHGDRGPAGRRILVLANETVDGTVLHQAIRFRARNVGGHVLVIAPAPTARHRMRDADRGRDAAQARLESALRRLRAAGIAAEGRIGDGDPMQALADALDDFAADEIIVATHPQERSGWLARDLVGRARARFAQPLLHMVVDLEGHRGGVPDPEPLIAS